VTDTIFALSSGQPPAGIAVVRISGPRADAALKTLSGRLPEPRHASLVTLRDTESEILDRALVLRFPGPSSVTGEDMAELHLHGGRSVVSAVLCVLGGMEGLRQADAGEFTRRAFANGRIDLAEAEGLADLLAAETETQRRAALLMAGGHLSRRIEGWQQRLLTLAAEVEAALDFSDEDDVGTMPEDFGERREALASEIDRLLAVPPAERLKDGIRVVLAGPPNAGKSSLFNTLLGRDAAITSPVPGTTRDLVEAPISFEGVPFILIDTAGLRESEDAIESIGVAKAKASADVADILLWLGKAQDCPDHSKTVTIAAKCDLGISDAGLKISAVTGEGIAELIEQLVSL
jgi:tRNA modification GTPase